MKRLSHANQLFCLRHMPLMSATGAIAHTVVTAGAAAADAAAVTVTAPSAACQTVLGVLLLLLLLLLLPRLSASPAPEPPRVPINRTAATLQPATTKPSITPNNGHTDG
jgi:hypothetical protein